MSSNRFKAFFSNRFKARAKITAKGLLGEFCSSTTLHGFRYITEPNRHWMERVYWIAAIALSIVGCTIAIVHIWNTWTNHPITVAFDDKATPINEIPFPAVTIYPTQKLKGKIDDRSIFDDKDILEAFSQVCAIENPEGSISQNFSIYETIEKMSPSKSSIIRKVAWNHLIENARFEPIYTRQGLCFTFNSINSQEIFTDEIALQLLTVQNNVSAAHWNADDGYQSNVNESELYPRHVTGSIFLNILSIVAIAQLDKSYEYCNMYTPGFMLSLHMPDDIPDFKKIDIFVRAEEFAKIRIEPKVTVTSKGLWKYASQVRGCYHRSERRLRFFKSYSHQKCELECLANFTKAECGCVQFYMPRDNDTKVCRSSNFMCYEHAQAQFYKKFVVEQCDCLPDCISVEYEAKAELVQYFHLGTEQYWKNINNRNGYVEIPNVDSCKIFFGERNFISINRVETSTMYEFISTCGGLLGIFMGASVISVVELIYYSTLRLTCWPRLNRINRLKAFFSARSRNQPQDVNVIELRPSDANDPSNADRTNQPCRITKTKEVVKNVLAEFCSNTTVHGVRYITEPNRHLLERVWWIVAVASSIVGCTIAIVSIWNTWTNRPITVTFDDKFTPISEIPFPAVTICTTQKVKGKINYRFIFEDKDILEAYSQVCYINQPKFPTSRNFSIYEKIRKMGPNKSSVIHEAFWNNHKGNADFKPIISISGLCYTFNSLNSKEIYTDEIAPEFLTVRDNPSAALWNAEDGYRWNVDERELYPYRVFGSTLLKSLEIKARVTLDFSFKYCHYFTPGFILLLHRPDEFPDIYGKNTFIPAESANEIVIKPKSTVASRELHKYTPQVRGCYLRTERRLRFFKSYSQQKCELECVANFTKRECGCVLFFMPRDNDTKVWRSSEFTCAGEANFQFNDDLKDMKQCECLPDCNSIEYGVESSNTQHLHLESERERIEKYNRTGYQAESKISIYFKDRDFMSMHRVGTNTMYGFFSSFGGLLGLFMAVSVISIVELVYFFTLRLGCRLRSPRVAPEDGQTLEMHIRTQPKILELRLTI